MYIFEVIYDRREKRAITKSIEIDEGLYTLAEAWHVAIDEAIKKCEDDEKIRTIDIIAY